MKYINFVRLVVKLFVTLSFLLEYATTGFKVVAGSLIGAMIELAKVMWVANSEIIEYLVDLVA
jgi:hypothetical protein